MVLANLFYKLREFQVPVSVTEYLTLLSAMEKGLSGINIDSFYYLARSALVKDERFFDRFDVVFGNYFKGQEALFEEIVGEVPLEWLKAQKELNLSEEEKKQIESLGGWEKLMETLKKRLEEQKKAHRGGSKMIGTGGTAPFGADGYNPEGIKVI